MMTLSRQRSTSKWTEGDDPNTPTPQSMKVTEGDDPKSVSSYTLSARHRIADVSS